MNIVTLINKLETQKEQLETEIKILRKYTETEKTAKKILHGTANKGYKYNGKHWTQLPKNKARLMKMVRANGSRPRK
jgi:hypothetical protein